MKLDPTQILHLVQYRNQVHPGQLSEIRYAPTMLDGHLLFEATYTRSELYGEKVAREYRLRYRTPPTAKASMSYRAEDLADWDWVLEMGGTDDTVEQYSSARVGSLIVAVKPAPPKYQGGAFW